MHENRLFLGLDVGTQSFKACLLDIHCNLVAQYSIDYDSRLPHYKTSGGVHVTPNGESEGVYRVTVPPMMFIEALDLILRHFSAPDKNYLRRVFGVAVSGQQHGSVYWRNGCLSNVLEKHLSHCGHDHQNNDDVQDEKHFLTDICNRYKDQMFLCDSPIWMDSSTHRECVQLENSVLGGTMRMIQLTGSKATERFTASHILRLYNQGRGSDFEHVSLISSFIPSLLIGGYSPIDYSDASGMNLLDIEACQWSTDCLNAASCGNEHELRMQLGEVVVPTLTHVGCVSEYMHRTYHFPKQCKVLVGTGDNPSSACGILRKKSDIAISLGTSHTLFGYTSKHEILSDGCDANAYEGHTFVSPLFNNSDNKQEEHTSVPKFMKLICFKNGANVRNLLAQRFNNDWRALEEHLAQQVKIHRSTSKQNQSTNQVPIMFAYLHSEITPYTRSAHGIFKYSEDNNTKFVSVKEIEKDDALSIIESQCMALKIHAKKAGLLVNNGDEQQRLIVTGGASESKTMVFILAQVFASDIYVMENSKDSAVIGAALRAVYSDESVQESYNSYLTMVDRSLGEMQCIARVDRELSHWYTTALEKEYETRENELVQQLLRT